MNRAQLKRAYDQLQLIIYKNKYLIPKKPCRPASLFTQFMKKQRKTMQLVNNLKFVKGGQARLMLMQTIKQKIKNNDPSYLQLKKQQQKKNEQYKKKINIYNQKYINPLKIFKKYTPYNCYMSIKMKQRGKNQGSFSTISKMWKQLPITQKQKMVKLSIQKKNQFMEHYRMFIQNHQIPQIYNINAVNVFISQNYNKSQRLVKQQQNLQGEGRDQQQVQEEANILKKGGNFKFLLSEYTKLSDLEKQHYEEEAKLKKIKMSQKYNAFLSKWNLTQKQLQHIQQICQIYNQKIKIKPKKLLQDILEVSEERNDDFIKGIQKTIQEEDITTIYDDKDRSK